MVADIGTFRRNRKRLPNIDVFAREAEGARHHPNHRAALTIEKNRSPDDLRVRPKAILPKPITQDGDLSMSWLLFVGAEDAAKKWLSTQNRKKIRRSPVCPDAQGVSAAGEGECTNRKPRQMSKALALTILQILGLRNGDLHHPAGREGVPDSYNARSVEIWERPQQ